MANLRLRLADLNVTLDIGREHSVFLGRDKALEHQTLNTGEDTELHKGDHLYLLREVCPAGGFKYQYDFVVESAYPQAQVEAPPFKKQRRDTSPEFVLEKLAKMPKRKCRKVLFHGKRLDLPVGVNFVVPEWVSECIANAEVFTSNRFQIDMQRIAISEGIRLKDTQDPSSVSGRPKFSGATSGVEWGFNGRWEEPWNEADAKETLRKLERFWYRQGTAKEAAEGDVDTDGPDAAQDLELQASERLHGSASQGPVNTVCTHVACSQQKICLIAELDVIKKNYRGPDKQFKQKAIDRAISAVNAQNKPLVFGSDVDDFDIGEGAKVKLAALINKGSFDRAEAAKGNEHRRVVDQFMAVWGAAEATAERWYNDGARTLDDVRKRTDLTEQQTVGLKYFDDLQHLIPRVEAVKVEQLVYTTACKLLGCDPEAESDRIHCRGMGSYLRGKPATGDIDFLIMPPASAGEVAPGPLLQSLLTSLLRKGLLLNELSPGRPRSVHDRSATWLGLCKPAGSQYVRRIDIKVYKRSALAYAVNYFSGSGSFVRALRFWARASKECAARAAAVVPAANGFKLSDVALVPVLKTRERNAADRQDKNTEVIVGPNQECSCETDIFRMLGLAYVPPSMRFFGAQFE
ncbi:hypothetical protein WJX72_011724 [[Myrmecia] bisecta]|uniref:DNA polymerase n=1 Tax=[Myrmecia] bisecta TaxID=41462 RepID=A0AAW1QGP0_9CHLO